MLFKDQAYSLVAKWENLRYGDNIREIAGQTAVTLSAVDDVPLHVMDALDNLLSDTFDKQATSIYDVVRYLRSLTADRSVRLAPPHDPLS